MKKFTIVSIFLLCLTGVNAQVTLEHTYNFSAALVKFETLGYKYYLMDVPNAQCRIYNIDHSLFRTIPCAVPAGCFLSDIKFLSQNLFDNDSGIELVYTWYRYIPTSISSYYDYDSRIINEDGTPLLTIDGARYVYLSQLGENFKLLAYCYDYSVWPEKIWTNIYSLPGIPVYSTLSAAETNDAKLKMFPNPALNAVKVEYILPKQVNEGVLFMYDNNGNLVNRFTIDNHTNHLLLDVSSYPAGVYHYFVEYENRRSASNKLVVR